MNPPLLFIPLVGGRIRRLSPQLPFRFEKGFPFPDPGNSHLHPSRVHNPGMLQLGSGGRCRAKLCSGAGASKRSSAPRSQLPLSMAAPLHSVESLGSQLSLPRPNSNALRHCFKQWTADSSAECSADLLTRRSPPSLLILVLRLFLRLECSSE